MLNKKLFLTIALLSIGLTTISAQSEEDTIREVIESETYSISHCDYEGWAARWWPENYTYFSVTAPSWHLGLNGWEEISAWAKNLTDGCDPALAQTQPKYDYQFAINGNMAFVTFLEDAGNESTRVLEKRDGEWRLIRMGLILTDNYHQVERQQELAQFAGHWLADMSTLKMEPLPESWEVQSFQFTNEVTPSGIRLVHERSWTDPVGQFDYRREMTVVTASGSEEFGHFVSGSSSDGWSHYNHGTSSLEEDGTLVSIPLKPNSGQPDETGWLRLTENGQLQLEVETYDDEGEVNFRFSVLMNKQN